MDTRKIPAVMIPRTMIPNRFNSIVPEEAMEEVKKKLDHEKRSGKLMEHVQYEVGAVVCLEFM